MPLIVKVCAAAPINADVGESVVIVGTGLLTAKLTVFDVPPPGAGFVTITGKLPTVAWSPAVSGIVICAALTNVTVCATPLYVAVEVVDEIGAIDGQRLRPAPTTADVGESVVMVGVRLLTVKLTVFEVPPPGAGFVTTTG